MPIIAVPRDRSRYGMIVDTTAGRITNAARAHAVEAARTGTRVHTFGIQIAIVRPTPNSPINTPTKAIAAGGLLRNSASVRRPAIAMAMIAGHRGDRGRRSRARTRSSPSSSSK